MNEILIFVLGMYMFGIPIFVLFMFTEHFEDMSFKEFYFDNNLINELNIFGRFCYYTLTSFSLFYYSVWIILSWFVKLVFLKKDKL